jgi:hypothetical protein
VYGGRRMGGAGDGEEGAEPAQAQLGFVLRHAFLLVDVVPGDADAFLCEWIKIDDVAARWAIHQWITPPTNPRE